MTLSHKRGLNKVWLVKPRKTELVFAPQKEKGATPGREKTGQPCPQEYKLAAGLEMRRRFPTLRSGGLEELSRKSSQGKTLTSFKVKLHKCTEGVI